MVRRYKFSERQYRQERWAERTDEVKRRRSGWLKRLNRRAPWLKLYLLGAAVLLIWVSLMALMRLNPVLVLDTEDAPTTLTSAPRLSDGLELGAALVAAEVEEPVSEPIPEPEPVPLPPPAYAPRDAATPGPKLVALTFDDGPMDSTTPILLDILKEKEAKATFFVLGRQVRAYPEITKRAVAEGHQVESHSVHHQNYYYMAPAEIQADVAEMNAILAETIGRPAHVLRLPYGLYNETVLSSVGLAHIGWSVDPYDWRDDHRNPEVVRQLTVSTTFDGAVILLHDIYPTTVEAVAGIIDDLRNFEYEFVTIEELAARRGVALTPGQVYLSF